jgi:hypothetical protein
VSASSDITAGKVWVDGDNVDAAGLNLFVSGAAIQAAFITGKSAITPVAADSFVFYDASGAVLGKCALSAIITAGLGLTSTTAAAGNDSRFSSSITGIRKGAGVGSTDTLAVPKDFVLPPTAVALVTGAATLDCVANNLFTVTLTANATITLASITDGDTIRVQITQDGTGSRTLTWTTTQTKIYPAGAAPTPTATANSIDLWCFERIGNKVITTIVQALA